MLRQEDQQKHQETGGEVDKPQRLGTTTAWHGAWAWGDMLMWRSMRKIVVRRDQVHAEWPRLGQSG